MSLIPSRTNSAATPTPLRGCPQSRLRRLRLADDYDARIRIIHVEVLPEVQARQSRLSSTEKEIVTDSAIEWKLRRWEVPDATEAHQLTLAVRE